MDDDKENIEGVPAASTGTPDLGQKVDPSSMVEPPVAKAEVEETKECKTKPKKSKKRRSKKQDSKDNTCHENDDSKQPEIVDSVACISPAEQNKLSGKSEPKKRGRPAKKGKGKGKNAGKAKEKKATGKGGKKNINEEQEQPARRTNKKRNEHQEANADGIDDDSTPCKRVKKGKAKASEPSSSHEVAKPKRTTASTKRKVEEASLEERDGSVKTQPMKRCRVKSSPTKGIDQPSSEMTSKSKGKASSKKQPTKADADARKSESKSKNARKSAAYRRAIKKAKDEGLDEEACKAAGRKVF